MSIQFCLALLALSSLTAASDPGCEELIKPMEDQTQLPGKWILHAGASDNVDFQKSFKTLTSSWIEISPIADSDTDGDMVLRWADKINGNCHYGSVNFTFSANSTKTTINFNSTVYNTDGKYMATCPGCVLWLDTTVATESDGTTKTGRNLCLFTKTGKVEESQFEVVKKQAACLNLLPEFFFGDETDLCPDEKEPGQAKKEDEQ